MREYVYKKKIYLILFSIIDFVGGVLFFPLRLKSKQIPDKIQRILLIRGDHIGDIVASTVVLKPLKDKYPGAYVDFMMPKWASEIVENDPNVDDIIEFNVPWFDRSAGALGASLRGILRMIKFMRQGKYDVTIDLRGDARHIFSMFIARIPYCVSYGITGLGFLLTHEVPYTGKMHERQRNLNLLGPLGILAEAKGPEICLTDEDKLRAQNLIRENAVGDDFAVVHVVPGHPSKKWSNNKFKKVIEHIFTKGITPVLVGSESDSKKISDLKTPGVVDLSGKTSIRTLSALSSKARLFLGVDSGPAHIASGSGTPTIVLFSGVNDPERWAPKGENVKVICPGEGKDLSCVSVEEVCNVIDDTIDEMNEI